MPNQEQLLQARGFFADIRGTLAPLAKEGEDIEDTLQQEEHRSQVRGLFEEFQAEMGPVYQDNFSVIQEAGRERVFQKALSPDEPNFTERYADRCHGLYLSYLRIPDEKKRVTDISTLVAHSAETLFRDRIHELPAVMENLIFKAQLTQETPFYTLLESQILRIVRKELKEKPFSPEQLALFTAWYANEPLGGQTGGKILHLYFSSTEVARKEDIYKDVKPYKHIPEPQMPTSVPHLPGTIPEEERLKFFESFKERETAKYIQATIAFWQQLQRSEALNPQEAGRRLSMREKRVSLMAGYAESILVNIDDTQAMKVAANIVAGRDMKVLSIDSGIYHDLMLAEGHIIDFFNPTQFRDARTFPLPEEVEILPGKDRQIQLRKVAQIVCKVFDGINESMGLIDSQEQEERITEMLKNITIVYGKELVGLGWNPNTIAAALVFAHENIKFKEHLMAYSDWERIMKSPLHKLFNHADHPLYQKYNTTLESEVSARRWEKRTYHAMGEEGVNLSELITVNIHIPEGASRISLIFPRSKQPKIREILALVNKYSETSGKELDAAADLFPKEEHYMGVRAYSGVVAFEDVQVAFLDRQVGELEKKEHPIKTLEGIGFPALAEQPVNEFNTLLLNQLLIEETRIIDKRGYEIPLTNTILHNFGYTHLRFRSAPSLKEKTLVEFYLGTDLHYTVQLDQFFQLDFENMTPPSSRFSQLLHYTILSYLVPLLCKTPRRKQYGNDLKRNIRAEMSDAQTVKQHEGTIGTLRTVWENRYATPGLLKSYNYVRVSKRAEEKYRNDTGRILGLMNQARENLGLLPKTYNPPSEIGGEEKEPRIVELSAPVFLEP